MLDPRGWLILNNDEDVIVLKNAQGSTVDSLHYRAGEWFGQALPKGISLERRSVTGNTNDPSNWSFSQNSSGATPGFRNSSAAFAATAFRVDAGPRFFRPEEGEAFVVRAELPGSGELAVEVYDLTGNLVRGVFQGTATDRAVVSWDGKKRRGEWAERGPYVLLVRFEQSGNELRHKQALVVAPKR
jgi:hypothetical protein